MCLQKKTSAPSQKENSVSSQKKNSVFPEGNNCIIRRPTQFGTPLYAADLQPSKDNGLSARVEGGSRS